ncbi:MAG: hypothetical protein JRI96_18610 [Deltaproteobacteria bacterium]|nr:hypothetical protein [Deltaproteobacteria bacterium]
MIRGEDSEFSLEDSEFSLRLKKAGYRIVLTPNAVCYHSQPDSILQLIKLHIRNGLGVAFVDTFYPDLNIDVEPYKIDYVLGRKSKAGRIRRFMLSSIRSILSRKVLLLSSKIFYLAGYFCGIVKYRLFRFDG